MTLVFLLHALKGKIYHQNTSTIDTVYILVFEEFSLSVPPYTEYFKEVQILFRLQSLFFALMFFTKCKNIVFKYNFCQIRERITSDIFFH